MPKWYELRLFMPMFMRVVVRIGELKSQLVGGSYQGKFDGVTVKRGGRFVLRPTTIR